MIIGIGCDITKISRIADSIKSERFLNKVYTKEEIEYIKSKNAESAAGIFSAKESFSKSIGTGFKGFNLKDIEVSHLESGAPIFILSQKLKSMLDKNFKFHLSISHEKEYAIAYVVCEM